MVSRTFLPRKFGLKQLLSAVTAVALLLTCIGIVRMRKLADWDAFPNLAISL